MTRRRPVTDAQREIMQKVRHNPQNTYPLPSDHRRRTVRLLVDKGMLQLTADGRRFELKK